MRDQLSLCMIVKNEERDLARCLDSVSGLAREFIVVDTGSTDSTVQVAEGYGAAVIPFDFSVVDFAAARNRAIEHASCPWILMLDADETLNEASRPEVGRLVSQDANAGYFLERRNYGSDRENPVTDYVVRLFPRRGDFRFRGRVHETIDASILAAGGSLIRSAVAIEHDFSSDSRDRAARNRWYVEILKEEIAANPGDCGRWEFLAAEYHQLRLFDEAAAITERLVRMRPKDARTRLFLGVYRLLYQSDPARARAEFQAALELRPNMTEAESFLRMC